MTSKTVSQLRPDTAGLTLRLKVVSTGAANAVRGGKPSRFTECLVGDHTGCITLSGRSDQIGHLQPGESLLLTGAQVDMFKNAMRLSLGQRGSVAATEALEESINEDFNLSQIEFELVQIPATAEAPRQQAEPQAVL